MTTDALLDALSDLGVRLVPVGGKLRFHPASAVPEEMVAELRKHKAELLERSCREVHHAVADDPERKAIQWAESAPADELDAALMVAKGELAEMTSVPVDCLEGRHQWHDGPDWHNREGWFTRSCRGCGKFYGHGRLVDEGQPDLSAGGMKCLTSDIRTPF